MLLTSHRHHLQYQVVCFHHQHHQLYQDHQLNQVLNVRMERENFLSITLYRYQKIDSMLPGSYRMHVLERLFQSVCHAPWELWSWAIEMEKICKRWKYFSLLLNAFYQKQIIASVCSQQTILTHAVGLMLLHSHSRMEMSYILLQMFLLA